MFRACGSLVLLVAGVGLGCGSRHSDPIAPKGRIAAKLPEGPPLATPGEHMSYVLQLRGMSLGSHELDVSAITELGGKRAIVVQGHARSSGLAALVTNVDDVFTSWIDASTGRSLRWSVQEHAHDGADRERADARIFEREGNTIPVDVWLDGKALHEPQSVSLPEVWDYNAFLFALRAWDAPRGSTVDLELFRSRYMWHVTVTIRGKETVVTEYGEFPALRFDAHSYKLRRDGSKATADDERDFSIWISDDGGRVPLQMVSGSDYGEITLSLVDYQPGSGERLRP